MAATFLNWRHNIFLEKDSEKHQLGVLCQEMPLDRYDMFLRSLEENIFLDIVSQKQISCDLCTFISCCNVKKTVGRLQLEAPRAYQCKQILGLCHLPPQMENQCGL